MAPDGFQHHPLYLDRSAQGALLDDVRSVIAAAPLYRPTMPRTGKPLSVAMTNCGPLGWVTDKDGGYRYQSTHPETGAAWPEIPKRLMAIWQALVPDGPEPEACLVNWYAPGAKLGLHRDADETDRSVPVVSVSLGDAAWFRIGGLKRRDPTERIRLMSGDVVVLGGQARHAYHGVDRIEACRDNILGEAGRINLTLRRVTIPDA